MSYSVTSASKEAVDDVCSSTLSTEAPHAPRVTWLSEHSRGTSYEIEMASPRASEPLRTSATWIAAPAPVSRAPTGRSSGTSPRAVVNVIRKDLPPSEDASSRSETSTDPTAPMASSAAATSAAAASCGSVVVE